MKRTGFFCKLPQKAHLAIKRIASEERLEEWEVVTNAVVFAAGTYRQATGQTVVALGARGNAVWPGNDIRRHLEAVSKRMKTGGPRRNARGRK